MLHMDINKTIIQVDKAGGRSFDDVLNSNVAANVFGSVDDSSGKWVPQCGPFDLQQCEKKSLITYDAYVDRLYAKPDGMDDLPFSERRKVWKSVTDKRKEAVRSFTHPGCLGESFAPLIQLQRDKLANGKEDINHRIVPSFFRLVNVLSEMNWPFTLVFRTFGDDLHDILSEWRDFVLGCHYWKPCGPILAKMNARIEAPSFSFFPVGCVYRFMDKLFFCKGVLSIKSVLGFIEKNAGEASSMIDLLKQYCSALPGYDGVEEIVHHELSVRLQEYFGSEDSCGVGGLVDHYDYWASAAEYRSGGKVFPVCYRDNVTCGNPISCSGNAAGAATYIVFFDDNISLGDMHSIVDIRDDINGKSICDPEIEKRFCVPVNAFKAIVDVDYFVSELAKCILLQEKYFSS